MEDLERSIKGLAEVPYFCWTFLSMKVFSVGFSEYKKTSNRYKNTRDIED